MAYEMAPVLSSGFRSLEVGVEVAPIFEGCSGYWLRRPPQLAGCHVPKTSSSRSIPCRGSDIGEEDSWWDRTEVFLQ